MRMMVKLIHPQGFPVELDLLDQEIAGVDAVLAQMMQRGYRPPAQEWPRTPTGEPICPKHHCVMTERTKQNDVWYSHRLVTETGEERFCRGHRHGDAASDGFLH